MVSIRGSIPNEEIFQKRKDSIMEYSRRNFKSKKRKERERDGPGASFWAKKWISLNQTRNDSWIHGAAGAGAGDGAAAAADGAASDIV